MHGGYFLKCSRPQSLSRSQSLSKITSLVYGIRNHRPRSILSLFHNSSTNKERSKKRREEEKEEVEDQLPKDSQRSSKTHLRLYHLLLLLLLFLLLILRFSFLLLLFSPWAMVGGVMYTNVGGGRLACEPLEVGLPEPASKAFIFPLYFLFDFGTQSTLHIYKYKRMSILHLFASGLPGGVGAKRWLKW